MDVEFPLGKVIELRIQDKHGVVNMIQEHFQKSVGLNGVGTQAVNALFGLFYKVQAYRGR